MAALPLYRKCRKYLRLGDIGLGYTLLLTPSPDSNSVVSLRIRTFYYLLFIIIRHTRYSSSPLSPSDWLIYAPGWSTGLPDPGPDWPDAGDSPTASA